MAAIAASNSDIGKRCVITGVRVEFARAEESRHLVPCVVHLSSDDSVDGDALEDHFLREVELDRLRWNAEHLHSSADSHESERLVNRGGNAGHLEHHIDSESVGCRLHDGIRFLRA